ncbi:MAG: hypothetical protein C0425_06125 [Chlorobiaceae bacterium]|nr:hypothetical protein [Chlorobiaceae bacterium]MBA4309897.1 hypothetical protein [Chlorobiaceae bacterium]
MNRKLKNTFSLFGVLVFLIALGVAYIYFFQLRTISNKKTELVKLREFEYDPVLLKEDLKTKLIKSELIDSILSARKFNIPQNLSMLEFYDFITKIRPLFSSDFQTNIEFIEQKPEGEFFFYNYKIAGQGTYNDIYQLIFAIEQSKELKKIKTLNLSNLVASKDDEGIKYLVAYEIVVSVYYSLDNRFSVANLVENRLIARKLSDAFYPLILSEIPPNIDGLLDVQQGAKLLALVPEGAFIVDVAGNSFIVNEGDPVYLGYATRVDYEKNTVKFILNKGGIVEQIELKLTKEVKPK